MPHFLLSNAVEIDAAFTFGRLQEDTPASTTPSLVVAAPGPWGPSFSRALKGSLVF